MTSGPRLAFACRFVRPTVRRFSGARATAAAIPGAELVLIEGMGHNLPPGLWDRTADRIAAIVQKGEARRR